MVRYEPPYVVHMIEKISLSAPSEIGVVYSSGNPDEAQAFAKGLYDTGAAIVEVRDSVGRLVRRFSGAAPSASDS
jgi:hypothetical protein